MDNINSLIRDWQAVQPLNAEALKNLNKKFRLEFNYNSNHLEGNTLSYGETKLLLFFDDTLGNHSMREYEEMKAHDVAWQMITALAAEKERPLTEQTIKELNRIILVRPFWKEALTPDGQQTRREINIGNYKQFSNSVRLANGEIFEYSTPTDTPIKMQELLHWFNSEVFELHPVVLAAMLHYRFVRIHPFDDGNGRIARLLMNYVLLRNNLPPVVIKSADKQAYLQVLRIADAGNDEPLIAYVSNELRWSLTLAISAAKGENIDEDDDWKKKLYLLKKETNNSGSVTVKRSADAYKLAFKNIIQPFLKAWEETLLEFDTLFNSRVLQIQLPETKSVSQDFSLINAVSLYFSDDGVPSSLLPLTSYFSLKIVVAFSGYRVPNKSASAAVDVYLHFNDHNIAFDHANGVNLSKLYSDTLSQKEITTLINQINSSLLKQIEKFTTQ